MADFPESPTVGQVFVSSDFTNWVWDGYSWKATNYGLIKLPVSQNSSGTMLANSMNFVNSEAIIANVNYDSVSGNADVSIEWVELVDPVAMSLIFGTGSEPNQVILKGNTDEVLFNYEGRIEATPLLEANAELQTVNVSGTTARANLVFQGYFGDPVYYTKMWQDYPGNFNSIIRRAAYGEEQWLTVVPTGPDTTLSVGFSGRVGVGTISPARRLHILGDGTNSPQLRLTYESGTSAIELYGSSASDQTIYFGTSSGGGFTTTLPGQIIYNNPANHFAFVTDGVERMRITNTANAGNVGIGTTIPNAKLHVSGSVMVDDGDGTELVGGGRLQLVSGYASPVSGRVIMGDGTGWQMHVSRKTGAGALDDLYTFTDAGAFSATGSVSAAGVDLGSTLAGVQGQVAGIQGQIAGIQGQVAGIQGQIATISDSANSAANTVGVQIGAAAEDTKRRLSLQATSPITVTRSDNGTTTTATFAHATTGAQGTYAYPTSVTVNQFGHVTSVTAGSAPAGGTVTSVTGGNGLTQGGTAADPVLAVGAGTGISVAADSVSLATAGAGAATYSSGISAVSVDAYGRVISVTGSAGYTSFAEPGIFSGGGTPTLATGVTGAEVRTLISAGTGTGNVSIIQTSSPLTNTAGVSGIQSTGTIGLNLEGLADMTAGAQSTDEMILLHRTAASGSQQKRKQLSEIGLSVFSNDLGFGTGSGTVNGGTQYELAYYPASSTAVDDVSGHQYQPTRKSIVHTEEVRMTSNIADTPVVSGSQAAWSFAENAAGKIIHTTALSTITFNSAAHSGWSATIVRGTQSAVTIQPNRTGTTGVQSNMSSGVTADTVTGVTIKSYLGAATILANATNHFIVFGDIESV